MRAVHSCNSWSYFVFQAERFTRARGPYFVLIFLLRKVSSSLIDPCAPDFATSVTSEKAILGNKPVKTVPFRNSSFSYFVVIF